MKHVICHTYDTVLILVAAFPIHFVVEEYSKDASRHWHALIDTDLKPPKIRGVLGVNKHATGKNYALSAKEWTTINYHCKGDYGKRDDPINVKFNTMGFTEDQMLTAHNEWHNNTLNPKNKPKTTVCQELVSYVKTVLNFDKTRTTMPTVMSLVCHKAAEIFIDRDKCFSSTALVQNYIRYALTFHYRYGEQFKLFVVNSYKTRLYSDDIMLNYFLS